MGMITSCRSKREEEGCSWARSCLIVQNKRRRGKIGQDDPSSFELRGGGVQMGGLYCAPTFQVDSRWNPCHFHVDSIYSIWNCLAEGPAILAYDSIFIPYGNSMEFEYSMEYLSGIQVE